MKKITGRRFLAYVIDTIIIGIIATAFSSIKFLNPNIEKTEELQNQYVSYVLENSIKNTGNLNDETLINMSYDLESLTIYSSVIALVVTFLYFSIFQYFTGGKTVGKAILGLQVVSTDKYKLRLPQTIIRSAIVNSIFTSSLTCMAMLFLSKNAYLSTNKVISLLNTLLLLSCAGMIIYRKDGVGLHDYLAHTKVVRNGEVEETNEEKKEEIKEEVIEAPSVEEVKAIEAPKKPVAKKPVAKKPSAKKPAAKKTVSKTTTSKKSTSKKSVTKKEK